ncbi:hypothetical protein Tco_0901500 [Tanacetum coccineum]
MPGIICLKTFSNSRIDSLVSADFVFSISPMIRIRGLPSEKTMASSPLIRIIWDIENTKSTDIGESIRQLLKVLRQIIPSIEIEITTYGDPKELTEKQRTACITIDFSIAWKKISKGSWKGPVMYLKERTMAPQQDMQVLNGLFWDMETAQLAKTWRDRLVGSHRDMKVGGLAEEALREVSRGNSSVAQANLMATMCPEIVGYEKDPKPRDGT